MIKDLRKNPRRNIQLEVELSFPSGGKHVVMTRDFSEQGVFLVVDRQHRPKIGEVVVVNIVSDEHESDVIFPSNDAVVVHVGGDGIGLAFIELDF